MKKAIICALLLCVFLSACGQVDNPATQGSTTGDSLDNKLSMQIDDVRMLCFYDLDEYKNFVETTNLLPDNFVPYEALTVFGSFTGLRFLNQTDLSQYMYSFIDSNGNKLALYVGREIEGTPIDSKYCGDMRNGDPIEGGYGIVLQNGVKYEYTNHFLLSVSWEFDGIPFILISNQEGFYPVNGTLKFVNNLMNTETNTEALQSFKASMEAAAVK